MESTCSKRFSAASSDETEWYLYAKRIKIESDQKNREKEEQQKVEQSFQCGTRNQTSLHGPLYLSERQNHWELEKRSCDTAKKTCMRDFFCSENCSNEGLPCRVSESELSTKKWSPENRDQNATDDTSLNVHGHHLGTEPLSASSAADTCQNLQILNPPQVQQNSTTEGNNERNGDNGLKQNSPVASLNRHLFQMELLRHKSVSDKKWQQYQLLQIPFLCGTSSVLSHTKNKNNNFLNNASSAEEKNYSSSNKENTTDRQNKEKNSSLYIIPTLKPFKSIQPLEIPNFQFSNISDKINSKMSSTNSRETDWKNFEGQPSLVQSKQVHGVQKISVIGKQKLQNYKSGARTSTVGSDFKEKNNSPTNKQEHNVSAEEVSATYFRGDSTDIECNKMFAENYFKDEMLENSEGDDDQKSKILIYISAKNVQNEKCVSCNDLLQRMGRKSSNENAGTFHIQTSIPVITEALEKNKLDLHCVVHNSNSDISLYEAESKFSTKEILDCQRYITKSIVFERNRPRVIVQNFPDKIVSCNIFRGKEMFKIKFSFQSMLSEWIRTWTESSHEGMTMCWDDSVTPWLHCHDTLNERCNGKELVKSTINRNHKDKIVICFLAAISRHLKGELLKTILASFFSSTNTLLPVEGKPVQVEKQPLCGRKQNQLNSCTDDTWRQNTEFLKENCTYLGFVSSKFVETIDFELHNECQMSFSRSLGEEECACLQRGALFHNQKGRLCMRRHVRKHQLLSRENEEFSTYLRSITHRNSMKKQILVAKCLTLLQVTPDCSSRDKTYCCNITKIQYLVGANLRFQSYFPAHSQLKFEKANSKCTNQEILVTTVKQERKIPSIMLNSSFHVGRFKAFPFALCENKKHKPTEYRNCKTSANEVTNEVPYTTKKYLGTFSCVDADEEGQINSKELDINSHNCFSKISSIFDTYEKISLTTDSEDFDQIPIVKQDNSIEKNVCEESAVTFPKEVQCFPVKLNNVFILPEESKATTEKYNCLLSLDRQTNKHRYYEELDTYSPPLTNKKEKVEDQNTYLNSENLFLSSSHVCPSVTLPLDSSIFVYTGVSDDGQCRSSSSADDLIESETIHAMVQYPSRGSPDMTDTSLQLQDKETAQFSLQGREGTNETISLEPATLKQHLEYVKEQEERNEQMHVTNESQCETVMNDLIMSHSEDESQTFIAAEEELKMHLSIMNNGCLEDVKDKYLPLENKITHEFELKAKFDLVLEELRVFHEISKGNENNLSSLETNSHENYWELNSSEGIDGNVTSVSQKKICISSPIGGTIEKQNITDSNRSLLNEKILNEYKDQEVPKEYCISRLSSEELLDSPVAEGAAYRNSYTWDPAFLPCTLFKEQSYNLQREGGCFLSHDVIRVQPLKTCKGPIRIGLSRKARPKQLHPYLK